MPNKQAVQLIAIPQISYLYTIFSIEKLKLLQIYITLFKMQINAFFI